MNHSELSTCIKAVKSQLVISWEKEVGLGELTRERVLQDSLRASQKLFPAMVVENHEQISRMLADKLFGLGPLEPLLADQAVTEIMLNGMSSAFVEVAGQLKTVDVRFEDETELMSIISKIVSRVGRRVDESTPYVDARLPDGSRVNAIIKPLSVGGPVLTIRKFSAKPFNLEDLVSLGTLSQPMADFLAAGVKSKKNILISGGTGSGKTSLLNALASQIPVGERIITIEDAAEIRLDHPHVVALEARLPNIEGQGEVSVRALLKNALRMRPDRIIIGETRGGEALDMLQAMNTGHQGSLATIHANSAVEALLRLETMAMMADINLPASAIRDQVNRAVGIIIQMERLSGGERKIVSVSQVSAGSGQALVSPVFTYDRMLNSWQ